MHVCTTHIRTHTHTHTHTHTRTHARTHARTHTHTHTQSHNHTITRTHTHTHMCTCACACSHAPPPLTPPTHSHAACPLCPQVAAPMLSHQLRQDTVGAEWKLLKETLNATLSRNKPQPAPQHASVDPTRCRVPSHLLYYVPSCKKLAVAHCVRHLLY